VDAARHPAMAELAKEFHGAAAMALHGLQTAPFWFALAGVLVAWWFYLKQPAIPAAIAAWVQPIYKLLANKYYFDAFNEQVLARASRALGMGFWKGGDKAVIDGVLIDGSAAAVGGIAGLVRRVQTGYLWWYALVMVLGIFAMLTWQLWPVFGR
jgi:NADH-quinone oxidoreductase subunit L